MRAWIGLVLAIVGQANGTHLYAAEVWGTCSGVVVWISDDEKIAPAGVTIGDAVTGTIRFDPAACDSLYTGHRAVYDFPDGAFELTVSIEGHTWQVGSVYGQVRVFDDDPYFLDGLEFGGRSDGTMFPGSLGADDLFWVLRDESAPYDLVRSLALPVSSADFDLTAVTRQECRIRAIDFDGGWYWHIDFTISSLELGSPTSTEPTTWGKMRALFR